MEGFQLSEEEYIREDFDERIAEKVIVLRTFQSGESSVIARIITPTYGKISAVARNSRASRKRFSGGLDIFDYGTCFLKPTRTEDLWAIENFRSESNLSRIRSHLNKLASASLLAEVFDLLLKDDLTPPDKEALFEVLELALLAINDSDDDRDQLRATFTALAYLTQLTGVSSSIELTPSSKSMRILLDDLERFLEKQLATRPMIEELLRELTNKHSAVTTGAVE